PMWDHICADKSKIRRLGGRSAATACIKNNHRLRTVGDFELLAADLSQPDHTMTVACKCDQCTYYCLEKGCKSPHECYVKAKTFLDLLPPKWDPRGEHLMDYGTANMNEAQCDLENEERQIVLFDRRITDNGGLSDTFRVFGEKYEICTILPAADLEESNTHFTEIATDGSCEHNGEWNVRAGAGVFSGQNNPLDRSIRLPSEYEQMNQTGEAVAILVATQLADPCVRTLQVMDSKTMMDAITKYR
ncbi:hypothetical protein GY45DRAFT_1263911, partial [Cubamyces sp. BRFM 1775]